MCYTQYKLRYISQEQKEASRKNNVDIHVIILLLLSILTKFILRTFLDIFGHNIISLICYDNSSVPFAILPDQQPLLFNTLFPRTSLISSSQSYVLQTLYSTISTLRLPTSWGDVDTSHISY